MRRLAIGLLSAAAAMVVIAWLSLALAGPEVTSDDRLLADPSGDLRAYVSAGAVLAVLVGVALAPKDQRPRLAFPLGLAAVAVVPLAWFASGPVTYNDDRMAFWHLVLFIVLGAGAVFTGWSHPDPRSRMLTRILGGSALAAALAYVLLVAFFVTTCC